ncbi:Ger(x)C family spore germination protein [Paenibacillus lupini]|uniref:Ger(x)C family spore germination protein n=1 Tax=Paenibacillus lupini TaxID=1450204 RepID=UPI0014247E31|nr:Ger(x)C family spore germination protein [Paenibacillus lupini]NIK23499.1 Ger(x)C family germination protein [Paenibacillus lupini]
MKKGIAAFFLCLLLTGCLDQLQLKNLLFVDVVGIDYVDDSKELKVNFVISALREANLGGGRQSALFMETTGANLYEAVSKTNKEIPGILSVLETRLYLISTKFAKEQPLDHLNIASQFASNPLYAYLAIYDGDLSKLLAKKSMKDQTVANFLIGLLDDEKTRGRIPSNKLLHYILGGTQFMNDFALNRFEPYKDSARLAGTSLFSDGRYTGINLSNEDTQLANLMGGETGKNQLIIGEQNGIHYSILVQNAKRHFKINTDADKLRDIAVDIQMDVKLIEDGPELKKHTNKELAKTEKAIEADLNSKAAKVIATIKQANCDYLQLAHEVAAFHPKVYSGLSWREQYPQIGIKPQVKVRILNNAILE